MKLLAVSTLSDIVCRFDCKSLQNSEFAEFKIKLSEFSYASCADAFWSGRTNPGPGQPLRILLYNGSYVNCSIENLLNGKTDCPVGWFGSADNEFCFQINQDLVDNEEAAR